MTRGSKTAAVNINSPPAHGRGFGGLLVDRVPCVTTALAAWRSRWQPVEADQVQPRPQDEPGQPLHELQRVQDHVRSAVAHDVLSFTSTSTAALSCTCSFGSAGRAM